MCRFPTILNEDNDDNNDNHIYISILWKLQIPRFKEPLPVRVTKNRITIRISILVFMVIIMMVIMIIMMIMVIMIVISILLLVIMITIIMMVMMIIVIMMMTIKTYFRKINDNDNNDNNHSIYISILWKFQMHCFKRSTAEKLILCELTYLGRVVILNDLHFLDRPTHRTLKLHIYMIIVEQMSISKISYLIKMMVITMKMIIMVILIMKICILILVMMIVV